MLTPNAWRTESRVIREANALLEAGFQVDVICDGDAPTLAVEMAGPITFYCLPKLSFVGQISVLWRAHLIHAAVLACGLKNTATRRRTLRFLIFYLSKIFLTVLAIIPLLALQFALRSSPSRRNLITVPIMRLTGLEATLHMNQFSARAKTLMKTLAPDIVHAHDLATLPTALIPAASWKVVYDAHELETQTSTLAREPSRRPWVEIYEAVLAPACDAIITVSQSIAEWLRDSYRIVEPTVIYNSPEFGEVRPFSTGTLRQKLKLPASSPLAVYVGLVTVNRGIEQCVETLAYQPNLHLALVGPRYKPVEASARAIAARLGALERLHVVDPVRSEDVTSFIADADCSLVTGQNICLSYYLSFPNKLLESVFAGLPVIGARLKELIRFMGEFPVGLIADETDPRALAAAIQDIIENRAKYTPTAQQRTQISARYGWQAQKQKLLELYAHLQPGEPS